MTTAQKSLIHGNILNIFLSSVLLLLSDLNRTRTPKYSHFQLPAVTPRVLPLPCPETLELLELLTQVSALQKKV